MLDTAAGNSIFCISFNSLSIISLRNNWNFLLYFKKLKSIFLFAFDFFFGAPLLPPKKSPLSKQSDAILFLCKWNRGQYLCAFSSKMKWSCLWAPSKITSKGCCFWQRHTQGIIMAKKNPKWKAPTDKHIAHSKQMGAGKGKAFFPFSESWVYPCRCRWSCSLQGSWTGGTSNVPSNLSGSMIPWFYVTMFVA